ncbi:MAG: TolC family protein [Candidatus Omnitrophica bacterium]|nr:TolC family protein [Candidatus Omnitrophota bacterium]
MKKTILLLVMFSVALFSQENLSVFTLQELLRLAEENNLQLKNVYSAIKSAVLTREENFTRFLPRVSSSASYTYLGTPPEISFPGMPEPLQLTKPGLYSFTLTVSQPVFTGGFLTANFRASAESVKSAAYQYQSSKHNLFLQVARGYFAILKARRAVEVTRELKKQAEQHRQVASSLFEQGLATRLDILKTDVFLAEVSKNIVETENALRLARASLGHLVNQEFPEEFQVVDILEVYHPEIPLEKWQNQAVANRPELDLLRVNRKIAEEGVTIAKSSYYPKVSLAWNLTEEKGTQSSLSHWRPAWSLIWAANLDIWNWQATRYQVDKARLQVQQVETSYQLLLSTIALEVKTAYLNWQAAKERIKVTQAVLKEAEENLRLTNLAFREGLTSTTEVVDAQVALSQARHSYYQAWYDYQVAYAELRYSVGSPFANHTLTIP